MRERATKVGGDVQVQSAPGNGTEVLIILPSTGRYNAIFAQPVAVASAVPEQAATEQTRLLLVDDHALFLDGVKNLLMSKGF